MNPNTTSEPLTDQQIVEPEPLTDQQIIDLYFQHPSEHVETFKRLLATLRLIDQHGVLDEDELQSLLNEFYGYRATSHDISRDVDLLFQCGLIDLDELITGWIRLDDSAYWPFGEAVSKT